MPVETEKDVRAGTQRAKVPLEPHVFLVVEGGSPTAGGLRCSLRDVEEVSLVRGDVRSVDRVATSERLALTIADRRVSGRHARIARTGVGWRVEDLGSTNGTFVNGRQVTEHSLVDGDVLEVGHALLRFRLALPTPEGTPPVSLGGELRETLGLATLMPALAHELRQVHRVSGSTVPILLLGDTGTGKEVVARAIHKASGRKGDFVAINCAALPDALVEAQLFGHTKGAFSGAARDEIGFVRSADGGTLFLDEVGDLPASAQGVLLRVLQEGEVVPVGGTRAQRVDVRIIAATHQPLDEMIERGAFRRDLFARLQGYAHRLWRLADRREDMGLLVAEILTRTERGRSLCIAPEAAWALVRYGWPLHVRELVQVLAHAMALGEGSVEVAHLPSAVAACEELGCRPRKPSETLSPADLVLRADLLKRLEGQEGNVAAVAREIGKAPMQVYRWLRRLQIDPGTFRDRSTR